LSRYRISNQLTIFSYQGQFENNNNPGFNEQTTSAAITQRSTKRGSRV
jgi:cysteine synthase